MLGKPAPWVIAFTLTFAAGLFVGTHAAKPDNRVPPELFGGTDTQEIAKSMLEIAERQAGGGSWERIGVARVRYLSGDRESAQATFDALSGPKAEASDLIRIARVLTAADDWEGASVLYDRALQLAPKDADWKVEFAAQLNLRGDRERAETLFREAFAKKSERVWNTANAAGSYLGVPPQLD